jgi:hypothetical protein
MSGVVCGCDAGDQVEKERRRLVQSKYVERAGVSGGVPRRCVL